ncbi:hypothetical protein [Shewanella marina]|uniref:hypothetical protein n=1 Tax=Shewanella marina TaxID=487319 RepID=UPI000A865620|nr:hypothetical protein [Shewanella marina]
MKRSAKQLVAKLGQATGMWRMPEMQGCNFWPSSERVSHRDVANVAIVWNI